MKRFLIALAMLLASPGAMSQSAASGADEGFVKLPSPQWSQRGMPPTLHVCVAGTSDRGIVSNTSRCTQWVGPAQYIQRKFAGKARFTRWEYQCAYINRAVPCDPSAVLYYQIVRAAARP